MNLELYYHWESDKAYLVSTNGVHKDAFWVPKSQLTFPNEVVNGGPNDVVMTEWFAKKLELL